MRYAYKIEAPRYSPNGPIYRKRADAVAAARNENGCGLRAGMRAVRVVVTEAAWVEAR